MNLQTVYLRPHFNTSEPHPEHEKFPYLLRKCKIERPNQVWSTDITYTTVAGHRAFVIGIVDWFSHKVLAYNVVNTMDAFHCVETLTMTMDSYGKPKIFNSDQGNKFTRSEFVEELRNYGIQISMDGDDVWIGAFCWALKYDAIKIKEYISLPHFRFRVQPCVNFYNSRHSFATPISDLG